MDIDVRKALTQGDSENSIRVTFNIWDGIDTPELRAIIAEHLPAWAELFASKNSEYGSGSAFELGERGQFSDMYRKMIKLKRAMWDADESVLTTESVDEIIKDLIGHCFLTLEMRARARRAVEPQEPIYEPSKMSPEEFKTLVEAAGLFVLDETYEAKTQEIYDGMADEAEETTPAEIFKGIDEPTSKWDPRIREFYALDSNNVVLEVGDTVRFKQHLGQGEVAYVVAIREDVQSVGLARVQDGDVVTWAHPAWLVHDGDLSPEERFLQDNKVSEKKEILLDELSAVDFTKADSNGVMHLRPIRDEPQA